MATFQIIDILENVYGKIKGAVTTVTGWFTKAKDYLIHPKKIVTAASTAAGSAVGAIYGPGIAMPIVRESLLRPAAQKAAETTVSHLIPNFIRKSMVTAAANSLTELGAAQAFPIVARASMATGGFAGMVVSTAVMYTVEKGVTFAYDKYQENRTKNQFRNETNSIHTALEQAGTEVLFRYGATTEVLSGSKSEVALQRLGSEAGAAIEDDFTEVTLRSAAPAA